MANKEMVLSYDDWDAVKDDMITYRLVVPAMNQMCDACEGEGMVDHPAFSNGITQSEREEMGEEDFQNYMDGRYDVPCPECKGMRVIQVPDVYRCSFAQKRFLVSYRQEMRAKAEYERESAAERRAERMMGC